MTPNARAAIAYIAGRLISGRNSSQIYDYSQSKYLPMSGTVTKAHVQIFSYVDGAHISGHGNGKNFSVFNYRENSTIMLAVTGNGFNGFDYGSGNHFHGQVVGTLIRFYDYEHNEESKYIF